ncbi:hypothetical protein B296_00034095 [Ensete ventricosum]|uniref:Uncharacterized protein n=1 Tax=Ensete ventricosum TaxID=4639 RepID=A0A426Z0M7_ENSVE|nr:hypothetical protein B296_00034095 [Ensete ventricosum]
MHRETRRKLAEGIGGLSRVRRELVGGDQEFVRKASGDFTEGMRKITRNTPGDRRRMTVRLTAGNTGGCRIAGVRS